MSKDEIETLIEKDRMYRKILDKQIAKIYGPKNRATPGQKDKDAVQFKAYSKDLRAEEKMLLQI